MVFSNKVYDEIVFHGVGKWCYFFSFFVNCSPFSVFFYCCKSIFVLFHGIFVNIVYYYNSIFKLYASWGVDFIKCDDICVTEFRQWDTPYSAYLKIAEGCDNRCHYCVIPSLRGSYRSRPMESLIKEAETLAQSGVKELMVVAQDISRYGTDLYGERRLHTLVDELCKIDGIEWIRLHYLYPDEIDDVLLETIRDQKKVLKYFDIPIQHINDRVLKSMNRRGSGKLIRERIDKIRAMMPDAVIRTSLIVGFPGETEEEYEELKNFLEEYKLERAGVFAYSREEGSVAYDMPDQIDEDIKLKRQSELFALQTDIMDMLSEKYIGKTYKVLCEGFDEEEQMCYGRTYMDSPDIDGIVYFEGDADEGDFVDVEINDAVGCILYGKVK